MKQTLQRFTYLEHLEIYSCNDVTHSESIQLPKTVEYLELTSVNFNGTHFFSDFTTLKILKFNYCKVSSTTMASLAKKCLELQNLTIAYMFFDDTDFLADFTPLKSLQLNFYNISNSTLACIAENCLSLQHLEIYRKWQHSIFNSNHQLFFTL